MKNRTGISEFMEVALILHAHDLKRASARDAEAKAAKWLHEGNLASERGNKAKAEKCYAKSQYWHDRMNRLLGNGDGSD